MENVEVAAHLGRLQVDFAHTWATKQLIADGHGITFKLPADLGKVAIHRQGTDGRQPLPGRAQRCGNPGNERMEIAHRLLRPEQSQSVRGSPTRSGVAIMETDHPFAAANAIEHGVHDHLQCEVAATQSLAVRRR